MANNLNSAPADLPTTEGTFDDDVTHLIVDIAELQEHLEKTARIAAR
jgi:ribosomal protein S15P/S13E